MIKQYQGHALEWDCAGSYNDTSFADTKEKVVYAISFSLHNNSAVALHLLHPLIYYQRMLGTKTKDQLKLIQVQGTLTIAGLKTKDDLWCLRF